MNSDTEQTKAELDRLVENAGDAVAIGGKFADRVRDFDVDQILRKSAEELAALLTIAVVELGTLRRASQIQRDTIERYQRDAIERLGE